MTHLQRRTTSTYFLFCSPQFLASHADFVDALKQCSHNRTLRSISCDEAHLTAQHGSSFRHEIRTIGKTLFTPIFSSRNVYHPRFIALTATMSLNDLATFTTLTTVHFTNECRLWSTPQDFSQDHIMIKSKFTSEFTRSLDIVVDHLQVDPGHFYVFLNSKSLSFRILKALEEKIDKAGVKADVLHCHGSLDKGQKFAVVNIVCGTIVVPGILPRGLVATAAAELGAQNWPARHIRRSIWAG